MSTLKVNTVQHNTTGFNNVVQFQDGGGTENGQLARAWVNFNGSGTVAIRADFNVNSITENAGNGDFTVNFDNAMSSANYCITTAGGRGAGNTGGYAILAPDNADPTASNVRVRTTNFAGSLVDAPFICVSIFS